MRVKDEAKRGSSGKSQKWQKQGVSPVGSKPQV